jgi:hypothetical protein
MRTHLFCRLIPPALLVLVAIGGCGNDGNPSGSPVESGPRATGGSAPRADASRPTAPPASLSPSEAQRRATAALLEPGEPAAILGEPAQGRDNAGPSLELGYCGVPFGGPGTTKLTGRTWYGGQVAVSQEVHFDPALRGAEVVAGVRRSAGQCSDYVDQLGGRNRLGPQVDLSGLTNLDATFGICVEMTKTINGTTSTGQECRGYLAWGGLVSVIRVAKGSSLEQHREPLRLVATAAAAALVNG